MSLEDTVFQRVLNGVVALADGDARTLDARGCATITLIADAGCTLTYSRVDAPDASAHTTGTENGTTVAADTRSSFTVDWPFWRVSAAGGTARVWVG